MGIYLGYVEKRSNEYDTFYNFKPKYRLEGAFIVELSEIALNELLPESEFKTINFNYNFRDPGQTEEMERHFGDEPLVIFEFVLSDLEDNFSLSGERNKAGYKISTIERLNDGSVRRLKSDNIYTLIKNTEIDSNVDIDIRIEFLTSMGLSTDTLVLVELQEGFYAGPYPAHYRARDQRWYVLPNLKESSYIIEGYASSDCEETELFRWSPHRKRFVAVPKDGAIKDFRDMMSDRDLLENLNANLAGKNNDSQATPLDIETALTRYQDGLLVGNEIPREISTRRLERLKTILKTGQAVEVELEEITKQICDLMVEYSHQDSVNQLIEKLLADHPDFFEQMKSTREIKGQLTAKENELADLKERISYAKDELTQIEKNKDSGEAVDILQAKAALDDEYIQKKASYDALVEKLQLAERHDELQNRIQELRASARYHQDQTDEIKNFRSTAETDFTALVNSYQERLTDIAFNGFLANKMVEASATWEAKEAESVYEKALEVVNGIDASEKTSDELIKYLCETVQYARPSYDRNTILNIAICMTQGFLTVFSGEPGSGKTSICDIMADVLGLNKIRALAAIDTLKPDDKHVRYIPVSVERGWTSKRDFIGYYNPLSKTFDKSNRRVYDALKMLNIESHKELNKFPFLILLDEANLSPMEYYWADFMNLCDNLDNNSQINLGEENIFAIPPTLHFVATINNDFTTEPLSPRLIDRSWIITLPEASDVSKSKAIASENIEIISWSSLYNAFGAIDVPDMALEIKQIYDEVVRQLRKIRIIVSPRTEKAVARYWAVASKHFEKGEYSAEPAIVALDYAIAQKILPKISGNGDEVSQALEEIFQICRKHNLFISEGILQKILERGKEQMKYYHFFE